MSTIKAFASAADGYAVAILESWSQLERDVLDYYNAFKAAGCNAVELIDDMYDRDYSWQGMTGTPEQIAASYHETANAGSDCRVLVLLDLNIPLEDQWPYAPGTLTLPSLKNNPVISESFKDVIHNHDVKKFNAMTNLEKVEATARAKFSFEVDRAEPLQTELAPSAV